jgi:hypothetical protein
MAVMARFALVVVLFAAASSAAADDRRAHVNYMLHCQGCHLPATEGMEGKVPPMKEFVGWFLHSEEGREFLIRVPGVSQSALDDAELAELMNWILLTHSRGQLPEDFRPFSADEVGQLRGNPEPEPQVTRQRILEHIAGSHPKLARALRPESAES